MSSRTTIINYYIHFNIFIHSSINIILILLSIYIIANKYKNKKDSLSFINKPSFVKIKY